MWRKSMVSLILVLGVLAGLAQAQLITGVAHRNTDTDAPEDPQIAPNPLDEDAVCFVDRTHIYKEVPESLIGAEYIMLANDNKNMGTYELDITLSQSATLYVFVDNRMGGAAGGLNVDPIITGMPWLTDMGFVDTGEDIGIDESADGDIDQYFSVFALEVKAGTVTIGGNTQGHGGNMLGVAALPLAGGSQAHSPAPEDGATDVPRDTALGWQSGETAATHDLYFGTDFADVNTVDAADVTGILLSAGQTETTYQPAEPLDFGQTYFWRVDEVNAPPDSTVFKGNVWSFTVEPYAYPIASITATASSAQANMGPENTVNGSGLDADGQHSTDEKEMWLSMGTQPNWIQYEFDRVYRLHELRVWNSNQLIEAFVGFGAKDVTVEYSTDGDTWTALADAPEFAQATATPTYVANTTVSFGGVLAQQVRLTINSTWGGVPQCGLAEVQFSYVPVQAREPEPADGATGVPLDTTLNWRPGRDAVSHDAYFSMDSNAVADGTAPVQTVTEHRLTLATLAYGTTYYWKVDEVGEAGTHPGAVWSFTTQEYAVVDDFESYTDDEGSRIYETWIDGYTDSLSGSTVGYFQAPFAEQTIVHDGKQSMPVAYDNTSFAFSEAVRTFDAPQDWTANSLKSLSLYIQGAPDNAGQLYVKVNNTKVPYNGSAADIAKTVWLPWNIDLSTVGGNLQSVTTLTIGVEGAGAKGTLYVDDIRLYPRTPEYITPMDPGTENLLALYAFEGNTNDTSGHGLNGTLNQGSLVASNRPGDGSALRLLKVGHVDLGNPPSLDFGTGDWTVTAWYKNAMTGTGDANKGTVYSKGGDSTGGIRYALIMSETTEGVMTLVTDDDATKYVTNSTSVTNDDEWHFVAGQREGTALRIYIDGQVEGTSTATVDYDLSGTSQHNAYIGAMTNHATDSLYKLYNGLIDDVRVYGEALSQAEILWLAGHTAPVARPF